MDRVRDHFPSKPAPRGGLSYPCPDTLAPRQVSVSRVRRIRLRVRRWWRAHWWPARIRDLETEIRLMEQDWR